MSCGSVGNSGRPLLTFPSGQYVTKITPLQSICDGKEWERTGNARIFRWLQLWKGKHLRICRASNSQCGGHYDSKHSKYSHFSPTSATLSLRTKFNGETDAERERCGFRARIWKSCMSPSSSECEYKHCLLTSTNNNSSRFVRPPWVASKWRSCCP